jgi:hypothetical protein
LRRSVAGRRQVSGGGLPYEYRNKQNNGRIYSTNPELADKILTFGIADLSGVAQSDVGAEFEPECESGSARQMTGDW